MRVAKEQVESNRSEPRPLALPGGLSRRRLLSFSPKLGRRVILANYTQRQLWLALEAPAHDSQKYSCGALLVRPGGGRNMRRGQRVGHVPVTLPQRAAACMCAGVPVCRVCHQPAQSRAESALCCRASAFWCL